MKIKMHVVTRRFKVESKHKKKNGKPKNCND